MIELCNRLEFRTLLRRVQALHPTRQGARHIRGACPAGARLAVRNYHEAAFDWDSFRRSAEAQAWVALRLLQKQGPEGSRIGGLALAVGAEAVTLGQPEAEDALGLFEEEDRLQVPTDVRELLTQPSIRLVGHDLKTTIGALRQEEIAAPALEFDTMVAAYLLSPGRSAYRLEDLARDYLGLAARGGRRAAPPPGPGGGGGRAAAGATRGAAALRGA